MWASAVVAVLALASVGAFGVARIMRDRSGEATAGSLSAGITIPEAITPPAPASLPRASSALKSFAPPPAPPPVGGSAPAPEPLALNRLTLSLPNPPNGMADLSVRIIDTGIAAGGGAGFVHANSVQAGERPAVVFTVTNVGTSASDRWQFTANLPTRDGRFISPIQLALGSGEGRRFTLGFGELNKTGENPVTVSVFSWNPSTDKNPSNDADTAVLERGY